MPVREEDLAEDRASQVRMPFVKHLEELRSRIILSLISVFAGMIAAYLLYDPWILDILRAPLDTLAGRSENPFVFQTPFAGLFESSENVAGVKFDLHFIDPLEVFMVKLKASLFAGFVLAFPFVSWQTWKFVGCGLTARERSACRVFIPVSLILFSAGLLAAYFVMAPIVLYFLVIIVGHSLVPMLTISRYVSLVVICCLVFGLSFQLPLVIYMLTRFGLVNPETLAEKRKYAVLIIFISAAMLTPPDIVTQILIGLPLIVLYEAGIVVSRMAVSRRRTAHKDS